MLFNAPKSLKSYLSPSSLLTLYPCSSALQRAEIAEMLPAQSPALRRRSVSVLFNEPKLLKSRIVALRYIYVQVSVLFNEPKLLKFSRLEMQAVTVREVSVLFNEPKLLKSKAGALVREFASVSVLFNEPKLLKSDSTRIETYVRNRVSVLFNEPKLLKSRHRLGERCSALPFQCSSTSRNC